MTEIRVPTLGESVTEATIGKWFKKPGDPVAVDEPLVELETDKVTLEVNATVAGTLSAIAVPEGGNVAVGGVLGTIGEGGAKAAAAPVKAPAAEKPAAAKPAPAQPAAAPGAAVLERSGPAVRRLVEETKLDPATTAATGKDGRLTKGDVLAAAAAPAPASVPAPAAPKAPRREDAREHSAPTDCTVGSTHGEPMLNRDISTSDGDETPKPRLTRQEIVVGAIQAAFGNIVAD